MIENTIIRDTLAPFKAEAVRRERDNELAHIGRTLRKIRDHDWNVFAAYPLASGNAWNQTTAEKVADQIHYNARALVVRVKRFGGFDNVRPNWPRIISQVRAAMDAAASQYDAFVFKMENKIGSDVVAAVIDGSHIWGHSFLSIKRADGSIETWKTQQISKVSCRGLHFNQWPSRKLKWVHHSAAALVA